MPEHLYAVVMEKAATAADVAHWLDADLLHRMWPTMWLPPHVRRAWRPLPEQLQQEPSPATAFR